MAANARPKTKTPETEVSGAFIVDNLAVWQLSSQAFRWSALSAYADCCFLRHCLWSRLPARTGLLRPQALPAVPPSDLRQTLVTSGPSGCPGLSQLALGTLAPGFLWLFSRLSPGAPSTGHLPSTDFRLNLPLTL